MTTNVTTGRRRKRSKYVTIENAMFEDHRLSWKAKGLLGYLLTKPDGWVVRRTDLVKHATDGDSSVRSAIKELQKYGYLTFHRTKKSNGQWGGTVWEYDDVPIVDIEEVNSGNDIEHENIDEVQESEGKQGVEPYVENQHVVNRHVENHTHISNTDFSNTNYSKSTNKHNKDYIDDDKRTKSSTIHNQDEINSIISNLREATKDDMTDRSFNAVVRKVADKYNQGGITSFRDYLVTALTNKIEELERRRIKDQAKEELNERKKQQIETRLKNVEYRKPVPFYNWLEEV